MPESRAVIEERVRTALDLPMELPEVEFKSDMPWDQLRIKISKTAMGMANRRDGGLIVIGVSQDKTTRKFNLDGMTQANIDTYVQEPVYEFILKFASPPVEVGVIEVEHQAKRYVAIAVSPFSHTPVVCKVDAPPDEKRALAFRAGDFIVRLADPVKTTRVTKAEMLHDLLQLAAGRRAAEIILALREGGVQIEELTVKPPADVTGLGYITQAPQTVEGTGKIAGPTPNNFSAEIEDIDDLL